MTESLPKQPSSDSAERAVLGCIFLDKSTISLVNQEVQPEDFYYPKNKMIYEAMLYLNNLGEPIDYQTVSNELRSDEDGKHVGPEYILSLTDEPYYIAHLESYLEIVKEKSQLRQLTRLGSDIYNKAQSENEKSSAILERAEETLLRINQEQDQVNLTHLSKTLPDALQHISDMATREGGLTGLPTGFRALDNHLSGLQKSDLILLAARPSMGKTALGVNIAYNVARYKDEEGKHPYKVAIFSLEMSKLQLSQRLISMASGINLKDIIAGNINSGNDWDLVMQAFTELNSLDIYIDDTSSISIQELRSKCRRMKMEKGLDLIVIDYLQLMVVDDLSRSENRQQEISTISRGLKGLAKELNCPVLSLSQLSRKAENREGARPMMSDMRESGAIEQDADVVMLLYREDYYNQDTENQNITDVIIAKHRNGPTGTIQLYFKKELTKFGDLSYETDPSAF